MNQHELILDSPVAREFKVIITQTLDAEYVVAIEMPDGTIQNETRQKPVVEQRETNILTQANVLRITSIADEPNLKRLSIRYVYGNVDEGKFEACNKDEGVLFSGKAYWIPGTEVEIYRELMLKLNLLGEIRERGV